MTIKVTFKCGIADKDTLALGKNILIKEFTKSLGGFPRLRTQTIYAFFVEEVSETQCRLEVEIVLMRKLKDWKKISNRVARMMSELRKNLNLNSEVRLLLLGSVRVQVSNYKGETETLELAPAYSKR